MFPECVYECFVFTWVYTKLPCGTTAKYFFFFFCFLLCFNILLISRCCCSDAKLKPHRQTALYRHTVHGSILLYMYILFDKPGLSQWFTRSRKEVGSRVATDDIYLMPWFGVWFLCMIFFLRLQIYFSLLNCVGFFLRFSALYKLQWEFQAFLKRADEAPTPNDRDASQ